MTDLMTLGSIARHLNLYDQALYTFRRRKEFPQPRAYIIKRRYPLYDLHDIKRYLRGIETVLDTAIPEGVSHNDLMTLFIRGRFLPQEIKHQLDQRKQQARVLRPKTYCVRVEGVYGSD